MAFLILFLKEREREREQYLSCTATHEYMPINNMNLLSERDQPTSAMLI